MRPKRQLLRRKKLRISPHIRWILYALCTTTWATLRRARPLRACCAGTALSVEQSLPGKQEQDHQQAENGVPEDGPRDVEPSAIAGEEPRQHGPAER